MFGYSLTGYIMEINLSVIIVRFDIIYTDDKRYLAELHVKWNTNTNII